MRRLLEEKWKNDIGINSNGIPTLRDSMLTIMRGLSPRRAYIRSFAVAWKLESEDRGIYPHRYSFRPKTYPGMAGYGAEGTRTRDHGNMFDGRTVSSPYWFRRTQARAALYSIYSVYIIYRFASNQAPFGFLSSM